MSMRKYLNFKTAALAGFVLLLAFISLKDRARQNETSPARHTLLPLPLPEPESQPHSHPTNAINIERLKENVTPPRSTPTPQSLSQSIDKLEVLRSILKAKNDSDPRLDTVFKNLSLEDKKRLQSLYYQLQTEDLNSRGTVIFLLGREANHPDDFSFLFSVLEEPVCLSLVSCLEGEGGRVDDTSLSVTLAYPQLMAVRALRRSLPHLQKAGDLRSFEATIKRLSQSSNASLARASKAALNDLKNLKH